MNVSTGVNIGDLPTTTMTSKYILWEDLRNNTLKYIYPAEINAISSEKPFVALSMEYDELILNQLKSQFPEGKIIKQYFETGSFNAFVVEK